MIDATGDIIPRFIQQRWAEDKMATCRCSEWSDLSICIAEILLLSQMWRCLDHFSLLIQAQATDVAM